MSRAGTTAALGRTATTLAAERGGSGPPLLLVHGLGSARTFWKPLLAGLTGRYDVISMDLPGHGDSPRIGPAFPPDPPALARAVDGLLDELDLPTAHIAGVSLGGWVALELAAAGRASSVTAFAPAGLWWRQPRIHGTGAQALTAALVRRVRWAVPRLVRLPGLASRALAGTVASPGGIAREQVVDGAFALADARGYGPVYRAMLSSRFRAGAAVTVPLTVLFADDDRVLPPGNNRNVGGLPAHAEVVSVAACGHAIPWDHPGRSIAAIDGTVARAPAGDPLS